MAVLDQYFISNIVLNVRTDVENDPIPERMIEKVQTPSLQAWNTVHTQPISKKYNIFVYAMAQEIWYQQKEII